MSARTTLDAWIARDAIPFSIDSAVSIDGAVDRIIGSLGDSVELLGIGEALHGSEEILLVRNLFLPSLFALFFLDEAGHLFGERKSFLGIGFLICRK